MNSRQRVISVVNHKPIEGNFPIDVGGPISGVSKIAYDRYLKKFTSHLYPSLLCDKFQQLACIHEEQLKKWEVDTRHIRAAFQGTDIDEHYYFDGFGVKHKSVYSPHYNQVIYFDQIDWPLKNSRRFEDIENFKWPKLQKIQIKEIHAEAMDLNRQDKYAIILDAPTGGLMELGTWLVGLKAFFSDLYSHYEFFDHLLETINNNLFIPYWTEVLNEGQLGDLIDIILIGDDFGMQDRMIISPQLFRRLVKPKLKGLVSAIKKLSNAKVMLHSCGSIFPIIGDLIEIGFDILNPLQPRAKDMDHQIIKKKFGQKLCFHGGIDIQQVIPRGTKEEVHKEVNRALTTMGADKTGYILATAHNILADVPPENIHAYISAKRDL